MANTQKFTVPSPYDQQMAELQRRQKMAELMQQQGMEPLESMTAPGGMVVKTSPLLGLAKMLQVGLGSRALNAIEKQRGEAEEKGRTEATNWLDSLQRGKQSFVGQEMTPDQAMEASLAPAGAPTQPTGQMVSQPYTPQERATQIQKTAFSGNPNMRMAAQLAAMKPERNIKLADINPKDFTPESLSAAISADNPSLLKPVAAKPEKVTQTQIEQLQEYRARLAQANPEDPRIAQVDSMIAKETTHTPPVNVTYGAPVAGVDAQGNPVFFQPSKEGGKAAIIPGVRPSEKTPTAEQSSAQGFAGRLAAADKILSESPFVPTVKNQLKAQLPYSSMFISSEQQKIEQAKRNFITAQLRRESGASISSGEFDTAEKMYFPQPGDSEEVIQQKAETRRQAIEAMEISAGKKPKTEQVLVSSDAINNALAKYGIK